MAIIERAGHDECPITSEARDSIARFIEIHTPNT